jgi:hypothetical protein
VLERPYWDTNMVIGRRLALAGARPAMILEEFLR